MTNMVPLPPSWLGAALGAALGTALAFWVHPAHGMNHGFDYSDPRVKWFESKKLPHPAGFPPTEQSCCGKGDAYQVDRYEKLPNGDYKIWIDNGSGAAITFPDGSKREPIDDGEYIIPAHDINPDEDDLDNPQGHSVMWATAMEGKPTRVWCFVKHPTGI